MVNVSYSGAETDDEKEDESFELKNDDEVEEED